ncbi:MAG: hypothetical protein VW622_08895 [Opitutae bacterium]
MIAGYVFGCAAFIGASNWNSQAHRFGYNHSVSLDSGRMKKDVNLAEKITFVFYPP